MNIHTQCANCVHFHNLRTDANSCAAFPDGIPREILGNQADHRQPIEGDNGIRWKQIDPVVPHPMEE